MVVGGGKREGIDARGRGADGDAGGGRRRGSGTLTDGDDHKPRGRRPGQATVHSQPAQRHRGHPHDVNGCTGEGAMTMKGGSGGAGGCACGEAPPRRHPSSGAAPARTAAKRALHTSTVVRGRAGWRRRGGDGDGRGDRRDGGGCSGGGGGGGGAAAVVAGERDAVTVVRAPIERAA